MPEAVIVSAARSPIWRAGTGSLAGVTPDTLAATVVRAAMAKVPQLDADDIAHVYLGCSAVDPELGDDLARRVAVRLGLEDVPATAVNRLCVSSVQTARTAFAAIKAGQEGVFVSAGVECGSHRRPGVHASMALLAERLASRLGISRYEQDEFGVRSHLLAERAIGDGFYANEITPITFPDGTVTAADEMPRSGVSYDSVNQFAPSFGPRGRITPGNSAPLGDGAAAVIIMSDGQARELGVSPLARIVATSVTEPSPEAMGLGAVEAASRALAGAGMVIGDMDLIEINEAFAVQVIASDRALKLDVSRLNVHGGAIALGHPFGMTGARIMTTLLNGLRSEDAHLGLVTLCAGGAQGEAIILERLR
jgi:acetyl-CoA C-acetyltransferase